MGKPDIGVVLLDELDRKINFSLPNTRRLLITEGRKTGTLTPVALGGNTKCVFRSLSVARLEAACTAR